MSARILQLAPATSGSFGLLGADAVALPHPAEDLQFWRGASGRSYVHTRYSLIECPPLPAANVVLARRNAQGELTALHIGRLRHSAPTLNLAEVRQLGARLGATEVHVHLLPDDDLQAVAVELDIKAAGQTAEPDRAAGRI